MAANEKVGALHVEMDASANKLGANLEKAGKDISKFSRKARGDLAGIDGGFLERLGKKAKSIHSENSRSGASALEHVLTSGPTGILGFGLENIGAGIGAGLAIAAVDMLARGMANGFQKATHNLMTYQNRQMSGPELAQSFTSMVPGMGQIWDAVFAGSDFIAQLTGNDFFTSPATRGRRERAAFQLNRTAESQMNQSFFAAQQASPDLGEIGKARIALKAEQAKLKHTYQDELFNLKAMDLTQDQKNRLKEMYAAAFRNGLAAITNQGATLDLQSGRQIRGFARSMNAGDLSLLNSSRAFPGGDSLAARREAKLLQYQLVGRGLMAPYQAMIDNPDTPTNLKNQAKRRLSAVQHWMEFATSDRNLDLHPYIPLRFSSAQTLSRYSTGAAQYAEEQDRAQYAKSADFAAAQKETNNLLREISSKMSPSAPLDLP